MLRNDGPRGSKCEFCLVSVRQTCSCISPCCVTTALASAPWLALSRRMSSGLPEKREPGVGHVGRRLPRALIKLALRLRFLDCGRFLGEQLLLKRKLSGSA